MNRTNPPSGLLRTIDVLGALSLAADLAIGLPAGHGVRASYLGVHLARELGLPADQLADLFYAELLMDAGCTAWASQTAALVLGDEITAKRQLYFFTDVRDPRQLVRWLAQYMAAGESFGTRVQRVASFAMNGKPFMLEGLRNTSEVAARLAGRLGTSQGVQEALYFAFEEWDGAGPHQRHADSIPIIARIVHATIFLEVFHQLGGREAAVKLARARKGKALDPTVVDAFCRLAAQESFWQGLESESIWTWVRQMEPDSPHRYFREDQLDDVARAFADFADLKSFYSAGRSRRVAALSERIALCLALPPSEVAKIRRAALVHDIGLVAVPSFILHKPADRLTEAEWEVMRLHPYHAERILSRVPAFEPLVPLVAAHHEQPDGKGYLRGIGREQIPIGASVLAVADLFDGLTHDGPGQSSLDSATALGEMGRLSGTRLSPEAFAALVKALDLQMPEPLGPNAGRPMGASAQSKRDWPGGLTDREVEVLRALATGASRRVMAEGMSLSEHTVRHHLEHIYEKTGATTRVGATLFALEHDLLH